jgi:hypothetical protein
MHCATLMSHLNDPLPLKLLSVPEDHKRPQPIRSQRTKKVLCWPESRHTLQTWRGMPRRVPHHLTVWQHLQHN